MKYRIFSADTSNFYHVKTYKLLVRSALSYRDLTFNQLFKTTWAPQKENSVRNLGHPPAEVTPAWNVNIL